jgi:hypothetical protein
MNILQLPLFLRKKFENVATQQTITPVAPTAESTVTDISRDFLWENENGVTLVG